MFTEKIKKLMAIGIEAAKLSDVSQLDEPYVKITWQKNGTMEVEFYSYSLELEGGRGNHFSITPDEKSMEEKLDYFISLAEREIVAMSRKESTGCN